MTSRIFVGGMDVEKVAKRIEAAWTGMSLFGENTFTLSSDDVQRLAQFYDRFDRVEDNKIHIFPSRVTKKNVHEALGIPLLLSDDELTHIANAVRIALQPPPDIGENEHYYRSEGQEVHEAGLGNVLRGVALAAMLHPGIKHGVTIGIETLGTFATGALVSAGIISLVSEPQSLSKNYHFLSSSIQSSEPMMTFEIRWERSQPIAMGKKRDDDAVTEPQAHAISVQDAFVSGPPPKKPDRPGRKQSEDEREQLRLSLHQIKEALRQLEQRGGTLHQMNTLRGLRSTAEKIENELEHMGSIAKLLPRVTKLRENIQRHFPDALL